jgi:hypothetical protein
MGEVGAPCGSLSSRKQIDIMFDNVGLGNKLSGCSALHVATA